MKTINNMVNKPENENAFPIFTDNHLIEVRFKDFLFTHEQFARLLTYVEDGLRIRHYLIKHLV